MKTVRCHLGMAIAFALAAASCSVAAARTAPRHPAVAGTTSSAAPSPTSTSLLAPTSTAVPHPPGLGGGDSGPAVLAMERRLAELHYDVGTPDGRFGPADTYAVTAFQKVHGLARTGWASPAVLGALATATDPPPLVPGGGTTRVEVDIPRQVLFLYQGGALARILPVSTGSGERYCVDGQCDVAVTPSGSFHVFRKKLGIDISKLGVLYNSLYFNGGIAIHGEPADPPYPASHGCVRIPMNSSLWFFDQVLTGTPVYVVGGPGGPPPFQNAPPSHSTVAPAPVTPAPTVPPPPRPTTTTAPPRPTTTTAPSPTTTTTAPASSTTSPASTTVVG